MRGGNLSRERAFAAARGLSLLTRGTDCFGFSGHRNTGLSPRTRGELLRKLLEQVRVRSIPAHAGPNTTVDSDPFVKLGLSPRTRGGPPEELPEGDAFGLSPRTRENRRVEGGRKGLGWSIPTQAVADLRRCTAYSSGSGLSPRLRGGTAGWSPRAGRIRVYPRERSGAAVTRTSTARTDGLSPCTRGKPLYRLGQTSLTGLSPRARGNPYLIEVEDFSPGISPLTRGGTYRLRSCAADVKGYPREPGKRHNLSDALAGAWSIRAHTGKPRRGRSQESLRNVYPHLHGGEGKI